MFNLRNSLLVGVSASAFAMIAAPALAQSAASEAETVIVTGTRVQGMTAADSAAPIQVLGTDALTHGTGSTDLRQQLGQSVPSFTAQQYGADTANLTLSAALRALSPNDTLVLVNGKRQPQVTPAQIPLAPGSYSITVEWKDGKKATRTVQIKDGINFEKFVTEQ